MKKFELEKQLIAEIQETNTMLNECELEYDALMGFVQENNLEDKLDRYLYDKVKNCDNEEQLEAYLRLITNEPEESVQPTVNIGSNVFINGVPVALSNSRL